MNTGAFVVFHGKSAEITAVNGEKIQIRIEGGATKSVRPKDVEFLHAGPVGSLPPPELPAPDFAEIAELLANETVSFADFTQLAYGKNDAAAAYAAYRILQEKLYFSGSVESGVTALPKAEIDARLAALKEKENQRQEREAFLERIRKRAVETADHPKLREIEAVALGDAPGSRLMRDLEIEATPEKAHRLLLELGVWDILRDPWPSRLGAETKNVEIPLPVSRKIDRVDLTAMRALAIDNAGSNDPDDAISFADGLLWVHVADPASAINYGDEIDLEARERGTSSYLPENVTGMLPDAARLRFGLGLQETSDALSFGIEIDGQGDAVLKKIHLSTIRVERFTYEDAAAIWEGSPLQEIREVLTRFRQRREANGALFLRLPEVEIKVVDGKVKISPSPVTPERELVANAMLAAGQAVARHMAEKGVAFPFVTQAPPEIETRGTSLPEMYALRHTAAPSVVELTPGKHYGLGLEPYCRVTSPLRRYADLLGHFQLHRLLEGKTPLSVEEMENAITPSENAAAVRRKLERYADEYFLMVYLQDHPDWEGEGIVIDRQGDRFAIAIQELAYEYKSRYQGKFKVGDKVHLKLVAADPVTLKSVFHFAVSPMEKDPSE